MNDLFKDMECYAKEANIPIMWPDAIMYIVNFIKENNISSVLEIGTAIGYSTLKMASTGASVVSIERDRERYSKALDNVNNSGIKDKIELINEDAFNVDLNGMFDLILIDAAKGKNKEFIDKFKKNLNSDGYIIIDNVDFHGMVGNSRMIKSRNLRSLVRKIERFLGYLESQDEFVVRKVDIGDGLIILYKRGIKDE